MDIHADRISFGFGEENVLEEISLSVKAGEFFGITGPNGSGKTTLLRLMDGLLRPDKGAVFIESKNLKEFKRISLARIIAYVSQEHELPFAFTVEESVLMGRYPYLGILGLEGDRDFAVAEEAMRTAGIIHLRGRLVTELSGGEKQRVVIARALAQEPKIMLLDEPTAHLDLSACVEIMELLNGLQRERGITIITASHELNLLLQFADKMAFLLKGRMIACGEPSGVITGELLRSVYGDSFRLIFDTDGRRPIVVPGKQ
ncbi:MAG TPA: ABC transporter ATP-binding protein [bacterium]